MKSLVFLILFFTTTAQADEWSKSDIALETSWIILNFADMSQTLQIATECRSDSPEYEEANSHLGRCPSHADVRKWFLGTTLLHLTITNWLPEGARTGFQVTTSLYTWSAGVNHNLNAGIQVKFK